MALALNRYMCHSVLPLIVRHVQRLEQFQHRTTLMDQTLHTIYRMSRGRALTKAQKEMIRDCLVAVARSLWQIHSHWFLLEVFHTKLLVITGCLETVLQWFSTTPLHRLWLQCRCVSRLSSCFFRKWLYRENKHHIDGFNIFWDFGWSPKKRLWLNLRNIRKMLKSMVVLFRNSFNVLGTVVASTIFSETSRWKAVSNLCSTETVATMSLWSLCIFLFQCPPSITSTKFTSKAHVRRSTSYWRHLHSHSRKSVSSVTKTVFFLSQKTVYSVTGIGLFRHKPVYYITETGLLRSSANTCNFFCSFWRSTTADVGNTITCTTDVPNSGERQTKRSIWRWFCFGEFLTPLQRR